jgi:hypothetical protein
MNAGKLLDWRKCLVYTHRWLGMAGVLMFVAWFASGIVFLYADMPGLSAGERLLRMRPLDLSTVRITPTEAARQVDPGVTRLRIAMIGARPVYRLLSGSGWAAVYADTGERLRHVSADEAVTIVRSFVPEHAAAVRYDAHLFDSDQWSLYGEIRALMPLHRIALDDQADTYYYVSERTGEPVLETTASGRRWAYASAVTHWLYFTPLRRHGAFWSDLVVWISLSGCVMCLSGLIWGVWRYSVNRRYRLKGERAFSPYAGMMLWHHYAGLIFGLFTLTWAFSGALSLNPFAFLRERPLTNQQGTAAAGGTIDFTSLSIDRMRTAAAQLAGAFTVKELEYLQFRGAPFFIGYRPPAQLAASPMSDGDVTGFLAVDLNREHALVSVLEPGRGTFARFDDRAMAAVAGAAMPNARVVEGEWLTRYDAYYYGRKISRPLPVLRVRFDDADGTWLYLDPQHGIIASRLERRDRLRRWLYHGFHSLDLPFLYNHRPLWDVVIITLCLGGLVLSATTLLPAWRRLRRWRRALQAGAAIPARKPASLGRGHA